MKRFVITLIVCAAIGTFLYGLFLLWERTIPLAHSRKATALSSSKSMHLFIPKVGVLLPILPATIKNNVWETTKNGVSHLATTPKPGQVGNSVIYGHNWPNILTPLHKVKPGDKIITSDELGENATFTVAYTFVTHAHDTSILAQTKDRRLTVYTCTGFLDKDRLVVVALSDRAI